MAQIIFCFVSWQMVFFVFDRIMIVTITSWCDLVVFEFVIHNQQCKFSITRYWDSKSTSRLNSVRSDYPAVLKSSRLRFWQKRCEWDDCMGIPSGLIYDFLA